MKTITLDFETYQQELKQAKLDGFELTEGLHEKLVMLITSARSYDKAQFDKAIYELRKLCVQVQSLEKESK